MTTQGQEPSHNGVGFEVGAAAGWLLAPLFGAVSFIRQARTFHPRGPSYHGSVAAHSEAPPEFRSLAEHLSGYALVRFSGALWKHTEKVPDVLGCAIRLRRIESESAEAASDDQDLLFATIKRPFTMGFAPLTTNIRDFLGNDYFAVSPFDVGLDEPIYLRVHPLQPSVKEEAGRTQRLSDTVEKGQTFLRLEASRSPRGPWKPLLLISLERVAHIDGEALEFRPFRTGRGVCPHGFVHALRKGVYSLSQRARPHGATV